MLSSIRGCSATAPVRPRVEVVEYNAVLVLVMTPFEKVFFMEVLMVEVCPFISSQGALL
jgi:hypothetical protein